MPQVQSLDKGFEANKKHCAGKSAHSLQKKRFHNVHIDISLIPHERFYNFFRNQDSDGKDLFFWLFQLLKTVFSSMMSP